MKWFKRTAQGFSPGNLKYKTRPERATDVRDVLIGGARKFLRRRGNPGSVAPSGRLRGGAVPRAKALGYSLRPFHGQRQDHE
jgi:hypothetical protein